MTEIYLFYCKAIIQINTNILNEMIETLNQVTQKTNIDQLPCYENINIKQDDNSYFNLHKRMGHAPDKLLKQWAKSRNLKLEFGKGLEKRYTHPSFYQT